jgi:hypothetical protein
MTVATLDRRIPRTDLEEGPAPLRDAPQGLTAQAGERGGWCVTVGARSKSTTVPVD